MNPAHVERVPDAPRAALSRQTRTAERRGETPLAAVTMSRGGPNEDPALSATSGVSRAEPRSAAPVGRYAEAFLVQEFSESFLMTIARLVS